MTESGERLLRAAKEMRAAMKRRFIVAYIHVPDGQETHRRIVYAEDADKAWDQVQSRGIRVVSVVEELPGWE